MIINKQDSAFMVSRLLRGYVCLYILCHIFMPLTYAYKQCKPTYNLHGISGQALKILKWNC
jgi:hypothetical protein